MTKQQITEEMKIHEEWYTSEQTLETLPSFLKHLTEDYHHDYGTICHAIAAGAVATARSMADWGGITGFQAGCVMWEFIQKWMSYETPMKLVKYENMLYPQYAHDFSKQISSETWEWLQEQAKKKLYNADEEYLHPAVKAHWQSIIDGIVPFGYEVKL